MEIYDNPSSWLALMDRPAFCVKDGVVIAVNDGALSRMIQLGTDVWEIVTEHREAYEQFENGSLYLTITASDLPCNASVTRTPQWDIFVIHQDVEDAHLQTLALAAQQLRIPLSNVMAITDRLLSDLDQADPDTHQQTAQINRGLYQLLRIVNNMSDSASYQSAKIPVMQTVNFTALVGEIMEKAQTLCTSTGITLSYTGPENAILGLANEEKLSRALYNLLSNAMKFAPAGSTVEAKLVKTGNQLSFTLCNDCADLAGEQNFWNRYRREPTVEDNRFGLGLGMTLVSAVAATHGGTVLVDHPSANQTRVTMTVAITKDDSGAIRSPVLRIGDYAGGRDKGLLEFAEFLPTDSY